MPEAAMHEDRRLAGGQDDIGASSQPSVVQSKTEPMPMQGRPYDQLRSGALAPDLAHQRASFGGHGRIIDIERH